MIEIEKGLFVMEEPMPCQPRKIRIGHYFLPATLGRLEQEEAAARIISFSQQIGQWVGVSWPKIVDMMKEDYEKNRVYRETQLDRHNERMEAWFGRLSLHFWLCVLTLGIWALFVRKPERKTDRQEPDMPFSGIYLFGPQHVVTGIINLIELNMLKKVTKGDGEDTIDVFLPTPTLISKIMEVQGVTVA